MAPFRVQAKTFVVFCISCSAMLLLQQIASSESSQTTSPKLIITAPVKRAITDGHIYGTEMQLNDILFINNDTKIVEIGLPKTGTTSLRMAWRILGYKVAGFSAKWWGIYLKTHDMNRILLEAKKYSALADAPWHTLHYQFWMKAYPNTKFIYQYRDEEAWLNSLESHFSPRYDVNRIGKFLDERWITNRSYIRAWWLEEHRQRVADVMSYFRDKPDKLLVVDITDGMEWKILCEFLNKPVPSKRFPVANKSHRRKAKKSNI